MATGPEGWPALLLQAEGGLWARINGVPHRVGEAWRDLSHQDVQFVLVVYLENLGHEACADRVRLAGVPVD